jgi:hypothetical protein
MLTRDKAITYIDVLMGVLDVIRKLTGDKTFPADVALAGIRAAVEALDSDKIANLDPDEIRGIATRMAQDLAKRDAQADAELAAKFDTTDAKPEA